MSKQETAESRVKELVQIAANAPDTYDRNGPLSRADWDELELLLNLLHGRFPSKTDQLIKEGFPEYAADQYQFGTRMQRVLVFSEVYGNEATAETPPELLPTFSLSKKDKERVSKLCDDMRKIVLASTIFDEPHKRRLLNRIAAIEAEMHQTKGKLDVILAGIVDTGDALGKFGKKIEPLTKRMQEVAQIARGGSKEYEQIPAPEEVKQLPPPEDDAGE
ncbi:hypothetical protein [Aliiroseovarius crassostreae]|uniref:hypothetical protein n=1 Tax=Aliiroseovarius crassostreae TaxID=154981 RepID=UPI00220A9182|nr:hypothetical protein [Aliiroseovarius crassostreae]UWP98894.1 hypothetical protein K3X53_01615 [Aliiroseovarius crassostreae]